MHGSQTGQSWERGHIGLKILGDEVGVWNKWLVIFLRGNDGSSLTEAKRDVCITINIYAIFTRRVQKKSGITAHVIDSYSINYS